MAKLMAVAVMDRAVGAFHRPFFTVSVGQAMRGFEDECKRVADDNPMSKHPKDFALFQLGSYDEETGRLESLDIPLKLCEATDFGGL
ncbi:MAG: nonstructural protein [Microvirus sp.]|nr:MAG: nonstructural protein [Microvirus sp.]